MVMDLLSPEVPYADKVHDEDQISQKNLQRKLALKTWKAIVPPSHVRELLPEVLAYATYTLI